jgi:hypothetical protein
MARVEVLREVKTGGVGEPQLCLHWCRYRYNDGSIQYGYQLVWRRIGDGSIQAARGQTRIPSFGCANELMQQATKAGWGDRDTKELEAAADRLTKLGYRVDLGKGHVGWLKRQPGPPEKLSQQAIEDAQLIHQWTH